MASLRMNCIAVNLRGFGHRFFSTMRGPTKTYGQGPVPLGGGIYEVDFRFRESLRYENLARFALDEYNKKQKDGVLEFHKVVKVKRQIVSGAMHYITLEAISDGGQKKVFEAKVWQQAGPKPKLLREFKHIGDAV